MQVARENYGTQRRNYAREEHNRNDVALPAKFMLPPERKENYSNRDGVYGVGRDNITLDGKHVYQTAVGKDRKGREIEMRTKRIARALLIEAVPNIELSEEYIRRLEGKIGAESRGNKNDTLIGPSLPKVSARAVAQMVIPYSDPREEVIMGGKSCKNRN